MGCCDKRRRRRRKLVQQTGEAIDAFRFYDSLKVDRIERKANRMEMLALLREGLETETETETEREVSASDVLITDLGFFFPAGS